MRGRRHPLVPRSYTPSKSSLLSPFPQRTASTASGASGAPAVRLASSTTRCAQVSRPGDNQARPENVIPRGVQPERDPRREAGGADHHLAAVRAQHVAGAGEVQDDLEEGEVRWQLRHLADGQEQNRTTGYAGELIMCVTQDE